MYGRKTEPSLFGGSLRHIMCSGKPSGDDFCVMQLTVLSKRICSKKMEKKIKKAWGEKAYIISEGNSNGNAHLDGGIMRTCIENFCMEKKTYERLHHGGRNLPCRWVLDGASVHKGGIRQFEGSASFTPLDTPVLGRSNIKVEMLAPDITY